MKRTVLLLLLIVGCGSAAHIQAQGTSQRSAAAYVEEVNQTLRDAGRVDISEMDAEAAQARAKRLAAQYAAQAKASEPKGLERAYLGYLYSLAEDADNAIAVFREVINDSSLIEEQKQEIRIYLISQLTRQGRMPEAEAALEAIPKTSFNADETLSRAHMGLSIAYTRQGPMDKALAHQEHAVAMARKSGLIPLIWLTACHLSEIYVALGRQADALKLLTEAKTELEQQTRYASGELAENLGNALKYITTGLEHLQLLDNPAPEIAAVKWLEEAPTTLAQLKGKVVAVELWAAWCPDCRGLIPSLREWATRYGKDGLKIISVTRYYGYNGQHANVASKAEEEAFLVKFKRMRNMPYGAAMDDGQKSFDAYHVMSIPTVALIDRAGRVRFVFTWHDNPYLCEFVIKKLLTEPAASANTN
jgi:thiol-disulfide isomerase/thioredoxin